MQHSFLEALEKSGSLGIKRGLIPRYICLRDEKTSLVACAPAMLKYGTRREFGAEHKWLKRGIDAGLFKWPKIQLGVPFFRTPGPRLLVKNNWEKKQIYDAFLKSIKKWAFEGCGTQVFNVMHCSNLEMKESVQDDCVISTEAHSVWTNNSYVDFDAYISSLAHDKRYLIINERQKMMNSGLSYKRFNLCEADDLLVESFYSGYVKVCNAHGNLPWLTFDFFKELKKTNSSQVFLIVAFKGETYVAGTLFFNDKNTLYAQIYSSLEYIKGLALELTCYIPIELAINGEYKFLDGGVPAHHKNIRGYKNISIYNLHYFDEEILKQYAFDVISNSKLNDQKLHQDELSYPI